MELEKIGTERWWKWAECFHINLCYISSFPSVPSFLLLSCFPQALALYCLQALVWDVTWSWCIYIHSTVRFLSTQESHLHYRNCNIFMSANWKSWNSKVIIIMKGAWFTKLKVLLQKLYNQWKFDIKDFSIFSKRTHVQVSLSGVDDRVKIISGFTSLHCKSISSVWERKASQQFREYMLLGSVANCSLSFWSS